MPEAEIKKRGGAKRYRTMKLPGGKYIHLAVVPKAGPRGGHTIAGPERESVDWDSDRHSTDEYLKRKYRG